jgi:hypothetical protein
MYQTKKEYKFKLLAFCYRQICDWTTIQDFVITILIEPQIKRKHQITNCSEASQYIDRYNFELHCSMKKLTAFSLDPPPKKAIDSACVRNLECMNLEKITRSL